MTACSFPSCPHASRAQGYCVAHHRQLLRAGGDAALLRPLRAKTGEPLVNATIRVPQAVADAIRADLAGARVTLAKWASRK